jgi:hypothetical protein
MTTPADQSAFDDEFRRLIESDPEPDPPAAAAHVGAPSLLVRRATHFTESLIGRRARFLLTSHDERGEWLAYGWKDGLRIVSESPATVGNLDEPALWIQEERDYYASSNTLSRFAVGVSRIWVEQYVNDNSHSREPAALPSEAWLDSLNANPNRPELRCLQPAQGHADPIGARVVLAGDSGLEMDLRAVTPVRMTDGGDLAIAVLSERDWYLWTQHKYGLEPHPTLRWVPAAQIWVE